jgi:ABC-type multidrug transport system fused ATPase/permease subunit
MSSDGPSRWRALGDLLRADRRRWTALGLLVAGGSAAALAGPVIVRTIVDRATEGTDAATVVRLALGLLAVAVLGQVAAVAVARAATVAAWGTTNDLRIRLARHVLGLDHEFHRRHTAGELISRIDGDVTAVSEFLGTVVPRVVGAGLLLVGMIGVLAVIEPILALGLLVYVIAAALVVVRTRHRAVAESSEEMGSYARLYGGIEEHLTAGEDLRANGGGAHALWRFVENSAGALDRAVRREHAYLQMWWVVQGCVAGGTILALVAGGALTAAGTISVGTAFLLFQYVLLVARPLEDIVHQLETVQKANGAMLRVLDLLAVRPTILDEGTVSPPAGPLGVSCRGVDFDYGDGEPVLHGVDLEVEPGRSIGAIGRSGSGKTTWSRLVVRLVEPTAGEIRLGGVPIGDIPMAELRRRIAVVPQEVELFAGTVRENVTMFAEGHDDDAVLDALRAVGLDVLADGGLDRRLGPGGAGLSAGEAQLVALARVWLRQPDLLVLDEATARVDPVTEARIEAAVARLVVGRTTIVIAHRLSTLQHLDDIVVFEGGRVVEHGPRAELADDPASRYARLLTISAGAGAGGSVDELTDEQPLDVAEVLA